MYSIISYNICINLLILYTYYMHTFNNLIHNRNALYGLMKKYKYFIHY